MEKSISHIWVKAAAKVPRVASSRWHHFIGPSFTVRGSHGACIYAVSNQDNTTSIIGPRQANLVFTPMRAAKVQASLRIGAVSPEPPLLAHTSSESRGTFRQKTRSLALLNCWACAVKVCHDGMLDDTNSLDAP